MNPKVDINMEIDDSGTPVRLAVVRGHIGSVRLLLEAETDVGGVSDRLLLPFAASQGPTNLVRELLSTKATVSGPEMRQNALKYGFYWRSLTRLESHLEATVNIENGKQASMEAFEVAAKEHNDEMLILLSGYVD
jgi:hypothetical protein